MEKMLPRVITENIALQVTRTDRPATILADASQLEQVIMNLAVNARDAMPDGGMLDLEARHVELDESYAKNHPGAQPGPYVQLAVSDNGKGISPENMERLFEPFFTTKPKEQGTGLGLATVYGIVQRFGGHLRVYSEVGRGTTFKVYWPATEPAESRRDESAGGRPRGGDETILVCEDEDSVRRMTVLQLRDAGYGVLEAENGKQALSLAEDLGQDIDLLVTDVIMPQMGGQDLSRELAAAMPNLKTLFVSGYTAQTVARHGLVGENLQFIEKPFSRNALLAKVREILDSRS
jgi:CheY-like chemotaxis protein